MGCGGIVFANSLNGPRKKAVCESGGGGPDSPKGSGSYRWWAVCKGSPAMALVFLR